MFAFSITFFAKISKQNVNVIPYNIPLIEDVVLVFFYGAKSNVLYFSFFNITSSPHILVRRTMLRKILAYYKIIYTRLQQAWVYCIVLRIHVEMYSGTKDLTKENEILKGR
jgi:hypothetical protein